MSELASVQRAFLASILDFDSGAGGRADIYRRNVLANLSGALAAAYPVVQRLVGDAFFREAARRCACAMPSASGDLDEYGAGFGAFLARYPHAAGLEFLPDVARLEWALHESRHAADSGAMDFAALGRIAPRRQGEIRLRLHPAVRLVASAHPVLAIWEANQPDRDGTPARDAPERVLVRRNDSASVPEALSLEDWDLLSAFARGATLDEACAALGDAAAKHLAPALTRYAGRGLLCAFDAPAGE
jgi:Putative DNA-binding domain